MKIKIECTQKEFAEMARNCLYSKLEISDGCDGCVFWHFCKDKEETFIEDIAEFKIVKENGNGH